MKIFLSGVLAGLVCLFASVTTTQAAGHEAQWKKVEDAVNKGLPQTAIQELAPIIRDTMAAKQYDEATKAITRRISLEGNIQGNKPEEKITRLEAELAKAPKEMAPMMEAILANWYWHYFQNNRWRFMQRTTTAQAPGNDFTTWDLPRLFAEIDRHFRTALASPDILKRTPVTAWKELLQAGTMPDKFRPTLYDFLAHEALKFYMSGEQARARAEDAFDLSADSPVLGSTDDFLAWKPDTTDTESPKLKAILLFQELLRFHQKDPDPSAFIDADLERLQFGYNSAFGESKSARYKTALKAFVDKWADHELSASALHAWARVLQSEDDLVEARTLAQRGANVFPNSPGGKMCANLISEIEAKTANVSTERVWNAPLPKIAVRYKNLTEVYFRVVAWDWNEFLERRHGRPEYLNTQERQQLMAKAPVLEWSAKLPATTDFKERVEEVAAPPALKPGFYFIISSFNKDFSDRENQVSFADFWVSDLALVIRPHDGLIEGFVLMATSGEPVADADVAAWHLDNTGNRIANQPLKTDADGFFSFPAQNNSGYLVRARADVNGVRHELGTMRDYNSYPEGKPNAQPQTIFFTDRALYRPGQTVQYKGICVNVDQEQDNYNNLPGQTVTVIFYDPNGKEIAKQQHRANDYGSFSGSFTAPRDRLMGQMHLQVVNGPPGTAYFNVEEYKRPKFQVTLDVPKTAPRLNDKVQLSGKAESYTGAAVDSAQVKYRVVREVHWPIWWGWYGGWHRPQTQGSQEIAHGIAKTGTDGGFQVEFVAKPEPSASEADGVSFTYSVYTDVTDSTGETRSAERNVNVGFAALSANLTADDWQTSSKPVAFKIRTTTLDGEPQVAEGSVKVYRLKEPAQVQRPPLEDYRIYRGGRGSLRNPGEPTPDLSSPNSWEEGAVAVEKGFTTDAEGKSVFNAQLPVGAYRAILETQDRFGKKVKSILPVMVVEPDAANLAIKVPHFLNAPDWSVEPGKDFSALWGTGYDSGRAYVEIEHHRKIIQKFWTKPGQTQQQIKMAITEAMRGGFTLHVTQLRENRAYLESRQVDVPWSNKNLEIKWEHFVSKLQPSQKETWTAVITGPNAQKEVAEMVATLYDASLDAFMPHAWIQSFGFFRHDYSSRQAQFENVLKQFQHLKGNWNQRYLPVDIRYRSFPNDLIANLWGYQAARFRARSGLGEEGMVASSMPTPLPGQALASLAAPAMAKNAVVADFDGKLPSEPKQDTSGGAAQPKKPDLSQVTARKNLNETAFFFPQLLSDQDGVVRLQFTMPEALTKWKFMGFAHDKEVRSGYLQGETVTAKDLMVQPNPPRFLREGDTLEFTVKVSNQTAARQTGTVRLTLNEAYNNQSADQALGNAKPDLDFDIPAKESRSYSWRLKVPDGMGFLTYKAVGSTGKVSDGEEGFLPVLSRRILVTESLPLPIRGPAAKKFEFTKLLKSGKSDTLRHQSLTVQMVSNPSWYAVMALPYLMEFPYECTEQTFNRLYANSLARNIANSDPKIHRVFEQWRGTPALDSPLQKNQDLKSVMLEETPWLQQAQAESQARRNVGILFDDNRLNTEVESNLRKLTEMQLPDGRWPWFPGGRGNDYITLYITTGFGRLRHLGVDISPAPAIKSLNALDAWVDETYREILRHPGKEDYVPSSTIALYLYGRSFFLKDKPIPAANKEAVDYFLGQARKHWLKVNSRQSQGHLAIAVKRFNDLPTAQAIMKSIKERSVSNEEMGMFWRELELSWWWYRAPIETHALMIEAFDEVMADARAVEDCKVWLLKQKQTQDWKTTKATADAVYALLLRGANNLASDTLVSVSLGGKDVKPQNVEAGTGFYEQRIVGSDIKPKMGEVTVKKVDQGVAWGSVHWQYLEDMTKVTPYEGTPLKLNKALFLKNNTKKGQVLEPVKGPVAVGDELVVRIELRVDRDMEYIHLKDQRGSGTEPVNVISQYKFQDGLAYYESTRDTASHFFIDYLPKGVYVFEYSTRVQHRGQYQTGVAEIQCMYAPEFNSHSGSVALNVK